MKPHVKVVTRNGSSNRNDKSEVSFGKKGAEPGWLFVVELLLFGLLAAISVWPLLDAAEALRML